MENIEQTTIFKFGIDETTKQSLKALALWAKINAILGFISIGMSLLTIIVASIKILDAYSAGKLVGNLISKQLLFWIISLVLNIILYKAAANIQQSMINNDQRIFNVGMSQLARYFKTLGIIFIVGIILVIGIFIFAILINGLKS
jgi:hypothetical protein